VPGVPKPSEPKKEPNVERYEAEGNEWIEDHTGIKRKPFKVMHREIKEIL
jgi:hypothetical protein